MSKRILLTGVLALFVLSCSSQPVQLSENEIHSYRAPASIVDNMEKTFQALMADVTSATKLKTNYIDRLLNINYRIEGEVLAYEAELDRAITKRKADPNASFTLATSPTYSRLMQLRYLSHKQVDSIAFVYRRLLEALNDINLPEAVRGRAERLIIGLNASLKGLNAADRLQILDLVSELRDVTRQFRGAGLPNQSDRMPASVATSWSEVEKDFSQFDKVDLSKVHAKYRKETLSRAKKAVATNDIEFEPFVNVATEADRTPSSEKYAPGTGTYGNVIGRSFPVGLFSLTYDDGPNSSSTLRLLDLLKNHSDTINSNGAPASLFWLTKNIAAHPGSIEKAKSLGFPINSHSWSHANLVKLNGAGLDKEINQAVSVAQNKVGTQSATGSKNFRFFRCPYGACYAPASPAIRQRLANLNLIHAFWTVDTLDWKYASNPQRTFELTVKGIQAAGRGVILFHDIHEGSIEASKKLLSWIKSQNAAGKRIRLKTLEAAVDEYNGTVK